MIFLKALLILITITACKDSNYQVTVTVEPIIDEKFYAWSTSYDSTVSFSRIYITETIALPHMKRLADYQRVKLKTYNIYFSMFKECYELVHIFYENDRKRSLRYFELRNYYLSKAEALASSKEEKIGKEKILLDKELEVVYNKNELKTR